MEKLLTVSIAAYNAEKWLSKCLDSFCVEEIMDDLDVVIVNDGSKDRTKEVAQSYVDRHPGTFRLIDKENGGHGSTINTGIQNASGLYFKLVDADDWVEREGLIDLVGKLRRLEVDAVISPYYRVNAVSMEKTLIPACGKDSSLFGREIDVRRADPSCMARLHSLTFRTRLLQEYYVPIDEHCFFVDLEYDVFYFSRVKTVYISDVPVYDYLVGTDFQSTNVENKVRRREQHLRVVRRLIDFYTQETQNAPLPLAALEVVDDAVISEYGALFQIPDREQSLREALEWDADLKSRSSQLYKEAIRFGIKTHKETAAAVAILRMLGFHGYGLIHRIYARTWRAGAAMEGSGE